LLNRVEHAIESRRLVRHLSACSASLCASDRLTRRREGAEIGAQRSHGRLDWTAPVAGSGRLARHGRPGQGSI